jgi:hypothetical protein
LRNETKRNEKKIKTAKKRNETKKKLRNETKGNQGFEKETKQNRKNSFFFSDDVSLITLHANNSGRNTFLVI